MAGDFDLIVNVEATSVEKALNDLDSAVSPAGLTLFLTGTVEPYLRGRARERFANEGDDAVGGKWIPLTTATQAFRESQGFPGAHPINQRTGELERYITGAGDTTPLPFGAQLILPGDGANGELLTKVRTAQQGDPNRNTPARPVLGMDTKDLAFVMTALFYFVEGAVRD